MNTISRSITEIQTKIASLSEGRNVRLVAVSKTKPESDIKLAYDCGMRHFGENYVSMRFQCSNYLRRLLCLIKIGQ